MLLRDARIGLPPTSTKIGLVCDDGRMRSATQLLWSIFASKATGRSFPSATISVRATGDAVHDQLHGNIARAADARALDIPVRLLIVGACCAPRIGRFFQAAPPRSP